MKIAIDARPTSENLTGVGNYILNLANGLKKLGHNITLIYDTKPKNSLKGVDIVVINNKSRILWEQISLLRYLRSGGFDIYHATWNYGIPLFYRGNTVLTVHDVIPLVWSRYLVSRQILGFPAYLLSLSISLKKAKKIIVDSNSTYNDLIKFFPLTKNKVLTVYLGLKAPNKSITPYKKSSPYFIYFGGVDKRKNIENIIRGFGKSEASKNSDLIIAGKNSFIYKNLIKKKGLSNRVKLMGYVSEKKKYKLLKGGVALIYPSFYEGFGYPPLEAMSVGTPVITSNVSSLPEIVGEAAIKINPYKMNEITKAVDTIYSSVSLRKSLSKKGLIQARKFSWDKTIAKTLFVYKFIPKELK